MRQVPQKKDANHDEIEAEYRRHHCLVVSLNRVGNGCPDLLVFGYNRFALVEVKLPTGKLTDDQEKFHKVWPVQVVRTKDDVAAHVMRMKAELMR